jgi:hypothetical protein
MRLWWNHKSAESTLVAWDLVVMLSRWVVSDMVAVGGVAVEWSIIVDCK